MTAAYEPPGIVPEAHTVFPDPNAQNSVFPFLPLVCQNRHFPSHTAGGAASTPMIRSPRQKNQETMAFVEIPKRDGVVTDPRLW